MLTGAKAVRPIRTVTIRPPWTDTIGLARTLLALSAFCLQPSGTLTVPYIVAIVVLLVAATGWRPQLTALPQWYIHFSLYIGMSAPDGGDQLAAILALILVPLALTDTRRWHWSHPALGTTATRSTHLRLAVAAVFLVVAKLQISVVYFQAGVAKFSHAEWADGTSFYYWSTDPMFGVAGWAEHAARWATGNSHVVVWLAWLPILLEVGLAAACLTATRYRKYLMAAAVLFHLAIAVFMGLWSFAFTMWAADLLLLGPIGLHLAQWLRPRSASPKPEQ